MMKRAPKNEAALDEFLEHHRFDAAYVFGLHQIGTSVIRSLMKKNIPVLYHQGDEWLANYMKPGRLKRVLLIIANPVTFFKERKIDLNNVVLVSEFMKERFVASGFKEHQLGVIYRGVEFPIREDFERERYGPPVFLLASRLTLYKGIHIAIRAASVLDRRSPETEWEMLLFKNEELVNYLNALAVNHSLYEYVVYESEVEKEFAKKLDQREDIRLFVKLPGWFEIDTPVGKYNPDWAIIKHDDQTLYLVRETKSTKDFLKLRTSEADKVRCGQKHFETLGVSFSVVVSADEV